MTRMRVSRLACCSDPGRMAIVVQDVGDRLRLAFFADRAEATRLARALGCEGHGCDPVCDLVERLFALCAATPTRVVLDDEDGTAIGAALHLERGGREAALACYPPDALALAVRADIPIYATPAALRHAVPIAQVAPARGGEAVRRWVAGVSPADFAAADDGTSGGDPTA